MIQLSRVCNVAILAILLVACGKKEPTAQQKRQSLRESVAFDASLTASSYVEALQECRIAGFADVKKCAKNDGLLLAEEAAKNAASRALTSLEDFQVSCDKDFALDYCQELVGRAIKIELRRIIYHQPHTETSLTEEID